MRISASRCVTTYPTRKVNKFILLTHSRASGSQCIRAANCNGRANNCRRCSRGRSNCRSCSSARITGKSSEKMAAGRSAAMPTVREHVSTRSRRTECFASATRSSYWTYGLVNTSKAGLKYSSASKRNSNAKDCGTMKPNLWLTSISLTKNL